MGTYRNQPLIFDLRYTRKPRCGHCDSYKVRKKDSYTRRVRHETIGHRLTLLRFKAYKLYCHCCGRYSDQQFPGIGKYQRSTERLQNQVYSQHTSGTAQKTLSKHFCLGKATIERWYHKYYQRKGKELVSYQCPVVLGIDEHSFSKRQ